MMTQKTISIPEELYDKLKAKKKKTETFPDLIQRLINEYDQQEKIHSIMDLAGALDDDSDEWETIEETLYNDRNRPSDRKLPEIDGE
jgi:predicted CopG family antitoxin